MTKTKTFAKKTTLVSAMLGATLGASLYVPQALAAKQTSDNAFNPAISLILDGRYTNLEHEELTLPGFQLGGEAGLPAQGFSTGHNELAITSAIDDKFYGAFHAAIVEHDGETEVELEEVFIETLGLGQGLTIKAGKFRPDFGYVNTIHEHAQDFTDVPLVYAAFFGGALGNTGAQIKWVAPTDLYMALGASVGKGSDFPGGEQEKNNHGKSAFIKVGGDINESSSWQAGLSYFATAFDSRTAGGHHHHHEEEGGEEHGESSNQLLNGNVDATGFDVVYKWAPMGNPKETNLKLQFEYFVRNEQGDALFTEEDHSATANYDGEQTGYYAQAVYQFMPAWRVGARYDYIEAENTFKNFNGDGIDEDEFLEESSLGADDGISRATIMVDYSPTHFSRIRLQHGTLDNGIEKNDVTSLQYSMSLGTHGAHAF